VERDLWNDNRLLKVLSVLHELKWVRVSSWLSRSVRRKNDIDLREKMFLTFVVFMVAPLTVAASIISTLYGQSSLSDAMVKATDAIKRRKYRTAEWLDAPTEPSSTLSVGSHPGELG
jgi:hypothetical protein